MIDVKQASTKAIEYLIALLEGKIQEISVEEVELSDDERYWFITLGFNDRKNLILATYQREYKTLKIDANNGKVISMKIRTIK